MLLTEMGGDATGHRFGRSFWLRPLPSPGVLVVVVSFEAVGVAETRVLLDADAIIAAGAEAVELWPWTPPEHSEPAQPTGHDLPAGGWFARQVAGPTE